MTFFARPDLSSIQFKQQTDSELILSGITRIATISGLTLTNGIAGGGHRDVIVTAEGATGGTTTGYVLTYDGNKIKLMQSAASGGTMYTGNSPASATLGGISGGTKLSGRTISSILQELLIPTLNPTLTIPSSTFTISPTTTPVEIGTVLHITGSSTFNRGCINPQYTTLSNKRSGLPKSYDYIAFGCTCSPVTPSPLGNLSNIYAFNPFTATTTNTISACVSYYSGATPKNSAGSTYCSALASGSTTPITRTVTGIFPYFYGTGSTVPIVGQTLINGACKCVGVSTGDIVVTNYGVTGKYIWFAIPSGSTSSVSKTKWQGSNSPSNCGTIPGDLFGAETRLKINSPSSCWVALCPSGVWYRFYISNYPTSISYGMTFKNS